MRLLQQTLESPCLGRWACFETHRAFASGVKAVEDVVKMGDIVKAKCIGIDDKGRVKMNRRAAMKELDDKAAEGGEVPAESNEGCSLK
jgi:predicted RNA-binding protein with RPS1 domain